jgi:acetolactate synthase-1/2/3 large subunit
VFQPGCTVIQVDIEAEEIGRNHDVDMGLVGDVGETLRMLNERAGSRNFRDHRRWIDALVAAREKGRHMRDDETSQNEQPIHQARLAKEIAEFLDGDSILVADGGETSGWMGEQAIVESAGRWMTHGYLGCLGVGMPFGMAAKVAHPEARVLVITGDGSAGLNFSEFDTAVRHDIPIVVVVNNDQGWGMIRHGQIRAFNRVVGAELGATRYDLAAEGFGAHAEYVTDAAEIRPALERAFASGKPACVNVMTDPEQAHGAPGAPKSKVTPREPEPEPETDAKKDVDLPYYGKRRLRSDR